MVEQEREKIKPKRDDGDGAPIEDPDSAKSGEGGQNLDDLAKKAKEAKKEVEKYRKRSKERAARIEEDDVEIKQRHRQGQGQ